MAGFAEIIGHEQIIEHLQNAIKMDKVKICLGREVIEISCKEFAAKYEKYSKEIGKNIVETIG